MRRFTRRTRRRRRLVAAAAGVLALAVLAPLALAVSPVFAVRRVVVAGADAALAGSLRHALRGQVGTPLALVDAAAVHRAIAAQPLVQSYGVEALPPSTLEIRVVPRTAIAQTRDARGYHVVDAARVVLRSSGTRVGGLPLVVAHGTGAAGERAFAGAAAVLLALPGPVLARLSGLTATSRDGVVLTLRDGRRVVWGSADGSAAKAAALQAALVGAAKGVRTIDVSAPGVVATR